MMACNGLNFVQAPRYECVTENYFFYFSTKTYVVVTQKNRLDETVLLNTQKHRFRLMDKKIIAILRIELLLNRPPVIVICIPLDIGQKHVFIYYML